MRLRNKLSDHKVIALVLKCFAMISIIITADNIAKSDHWGFLLSLGMAIIFLAALGNPAQLKKPVEKFADLIQSDEENSAGRWLAQYIGIILMLAGFVGKVVG